MKLHDVVELTVDLPGAGLPAGAVGTIVDEYLGGEAYEVEFLDDRRTLAIVAVRSDQIRPTS